MKGLFKILFIPILSLMFMALGSGLFTTFVSVRLDLEGISSTSIGVIASSFNAGILAGAILSPSLAVKFGCMRSLIAIYALNTIVILLHLFWIDPFYWAFLRFFSGIALGSFFTVMESWFLKEGSPSMRSQALSLYLIAYYIAVSGGQLLLSAADPLLNSLFYLSAAFSASAAIPLLLGTKNAPTFEKKAISPTPSSRLPYIGFFCAMASGIVIASIYGLIPFYGNAIGLSLGQISLFMCVIIAGGFLFQWPLAKWSDISGHSRVLKVVCLLAMLCSLSSAAIDGFSFSWLLVFGWLFGGASFALYPLSLAFLCDGVEDARLAHTVGKFVIAYSIGAILGPLGTSLCIKQFGAPGLFYFLATVSALSGLITFLKKSKGSATN